MDLNDWLTIAVPTIISIIGFVVTFVSLSKSFKNELNKQRMGVHIDKMSTIPYDILKLLDTMVQTGNQNQEITIQEINNLLNNILRIWFRKSNTVGGFNAKRELS